MAIEPSAMRGFSRTRPARQRGERADVGGVTVEWDDDGLARMGGVALIRIEGPLARCADWWSSGYDEILEAHDKAARSDARALLQVHHSPGGYLSGLDETAEEIAAIARRAGKPLHAISADMMFSASVRLACAASRRWTVRAGGVGSVGVIVSRSDYTEAYKLAGIRVEQIASGEYKTDGDPSVAITPAEIKRIKARVDYHAGLFFSAVAQATGLSVEQVSAQEAGIFLGPAAVEARLCDGVSTLAEAVARLDQETSGRSMVAVPSTGPRGQQQQTAAGNKTMEIGMLALALGLSADAKDQDITARASALVASEAKIREVTGKARSEEQAAVIDGWREAAAKLASAQDELAKVAAREEAAAYGALITKGEGSAQITPANREKVLSRFTTSAALSAYLEAAPAALPGRATVADKPAEKGSAGGDTGDGPPKYKGKAYADLGFSDRAAWKMADPSTWAVAKADYDRSKGG